MTSEDNKAVMRRYFEEALKKGDQRVLEEIVAVDSLKQHVASNRAAFPDLYAGLIVEDVIAEGDKVVARISAHGTHRGEFRGIPPTGTPVTASGAIIYRLADGKIVEHWNFLDSLGLLQQLGATLTPPRA
jgi:steroid delta-isomerase-like uncharacterized protein